MKRIADSQLTQRSDQNKRKRKLDYVEHFKLETESYDKTESKYLEKMKKQRKVEFMVQKFRMSEISYYPEKLLPPVHSVRSLSMERVEYQNKNKKLINHQIYKQTSNFSFENISLPSSALPETASIKVLVSGHFRDNKRPIFIIRQYRGGSVIDRESSDFNSIKTEKDVDIFISGNFYKESILEEKHGVPRKIRVKGRKKIEIDERSHILEEGFIELFPVGEVDVVIGGMFVKQGKPPYYTPLISVTIRRDDFEQSAPTMFTPRQAERAEMAMSMSATSVKTPFCQNNLRKAHSYQKIEFSRKRRSSILNGARGFKSLLTRIDEEEEPFECPQDIDRILTEQIVKPAEKALEEERTPSKESILLNITSLHSLEPSDRVSTNETPPVNIITQVAITNKDNEITNSTIAEPVTNTDNQSIPEPKVKDNFNNSKSSKKPGFKFRLEKPKENSSRNDSTKKVKNLTKESQSPTKSNLHFFKPFQKRKSNKEEISATKDFETEKLRSFDKTSTNDIRSSFINDKEIIFPKTSSEATYDTQLVPIRPNKNSYTKSPKDRGIFKRVGLLKPWFSK